MNKIAIIQARMGSTRLPGKVLKDLLNMPMLFHQVERIRRAEKIDQIVVATSWLAKDDCIASLCEEHNWKYYRGNETDVLDRYYQAAREFNADLIIRITGDCPVIEPDIIDQVINPCITDSSIDFSSNILPERNFPRGLDVEAIRFSLLDEVWSRSEKLSHREHVTLYIHERYRDYKIHNVCNKTDYSGLRWTVDTLEDFNLIECVFNHFGHNKFSWLDIIDYLDHHPEVVELNSHIQQKQV